MTDHLSDNVYSVLTELTDGRFHSGQSLGDHLQVSRTAIWKSMQTLNQFGVAIDAVPGKGYRLQRALELLDYNQIQLGLAETNRNQIARWYIFPGIDSTSDFLKSKAQNENLHGHLCLAEMQTRGRGRRGRHWVSPFGCNLYFSLAWSFNNGMDSIIGLSAAISVFIVQGLQKIGAKGLQIKWPNDIHWNGSKLVGILVDVSGESRGECLAIIGVGINVSMPQRNDSIDQAWTDLERVTGKRHSRNDLMAVILSAMLAGLDRFVKFGFEAFIQEWQQFDMLAGKQIEVDVHGKTVVGEACGIDSYGALCIETANGRKHFHHCDISVRVTRVDTTH